MEENRDELPPDVKRFAPWQWDRMTQVEVFGYVAGAVLSVWAILQASGFRASLDDVIRSFF